MDRTSTPAPVPTSPATTSAEAPTNVNLARIRAALDAFPTLNAAKKDAAAQSIFEDAVRLGSKATDRFGASEHFLDFYGKVTRLVEQFKAEGLTLEQYLPAALKQPQLFTQSPATIAANIRGVVEQFKAEGLTLEQYLPAALKQPSLFTHSPEKITSNIRGVVEQFKAEGLTLEQYLPVALKQPPLFYQSPATINRHIENFIRLQDIGLLQVKPDPKWANNGPHGQLLGMLMKSPKLLMLADENIALRAILAAVEQKSLNVGLLTRVNKKEIQQRISNYLEQIGSLPDSQAKEPEASAPFPERLTFGAQVMLDLMERAGLLPEDLAAQVQSKRPPARSK